MSEADHKKYTGVFERGEHVTISLEFKKPRKDFDESLKLIRECKIWLETSNGTLERIR